MQGNLKLINGGVSTCHCFTCKTRKAKLSMLSKEECCYDIPFINVTVSSFPMPVDKQGMNLKVDEQAICLMA